MAANQVDLEHIEVRELASKKLSPKALKKAQGIIKRLTSSKNFSTELRALLVEKNKK